jgi:xanthine/uracil permease
MNTLYAASGSLLTTFGAQPLLVGIFAPLLLAMVTRSPAAVAGTVLTTAACLTALAWNVDEAFRRIAPWVFTVIGSTVVLIGFELTRVRTRVRQLEDRVGAAEQRLAGERERQLLGQINAERPPPRLIRQDREAPSVRPVVDEGTRLRT